jgi:thioredoxin reductase (NADPH)
MPMSRYLIERIEMRPNIELLCQTEIAALTGTSVGRLERVRWRHRSTGAETERPIRNVFCSSAPILRAIGYGLWGPA